MRLGSIIMRKAFELLATGEASKERFVEWILSKGRGLSRRILHKGDGLASVREERTAYQVIRQIAITAQSAGTRYFDIVAFRHVSARIEGREENRQPTHFVVQGVDVFVVPRVNVQPK